MALEAVDVVSLEFGLRQQHWPVFSLGGDLLRRAMRLRRGLDEAAVRIVALEMVGADLDSLDDARVAEVQDGPGVAGFAPAARLPAIAHVLAAVGRGQVLDPAEVLI